MDISEEAVIVAHAYDKASFKDKKLVCMQLELPPPKPKLVPYQSDMETALELGRLGDMIPLPEAILKDKHHY